MSKGMEDGRYKQVLLEHKVQGRKMQEIIWGDKEGKGF